MIPLAEVQDAVIGAISRFEPVECDRADALGLVLAADVVAGESVPPFANTAMDGYAVRAADTVGATEAAPVRLRVVGDLPAGHAPTVAVGPGEAIRIMTGAPMPDGADAIVIVELTKRTDGAGDAVDVLEEAAPGARTCGGRVATSRPGSWCSPRARCSALRTWVCWRASTSTRCRCSLGRASVCCRPVTSWSSRVRSRRARSVTQPADAARVRRAAGFEAVDLGSSRTTKRR